MFTAICMAEPSLLGWAGIATAVRPSERALRDADDTAALEALQGEPEAVGAYDHVPFASATAVFLMDTASEVFVIHRAQVHMQQRFQGRGHDPGLA